MNLSSTIYLVQHDADINKEDNCDNTSLLNVCQNGNDTILQYLLKIV